jgi:Peptidase family M48
MSALELPPEQEREALIAVLGELVASRGPEPLVRWPLRRASPADFPDPWTPDVDGAARMAQRLLTHAGLSELSVSMHAAVAEEELPDIAEPVNATRMRHGTAAWFLGIQGSTCLFGVSPRQLPDPEQLAGVLAHEVGHAYRAHHHMVVGDAATEEHLTDVTTVFLGFGILTTNAADRFRSSGEIQGGAVYHRWSRTQAGYLSPGTMALLLGVQLAARHASSRDRRLVRAELERNQAALLDEALRWIRPREAQLRADLCVPLEADHSVSTLTASPSGLAALWSWIRHGRG